MNANSLVSSIFVYGTLRREQIRGRCWPRQPIVVFDRFVIGQLFDLGPYPALVRGQGVVGGELWQFAHEDLEETLRVLDEIEGYLGPGRRNLYERDIVSVYPTPDSTIDLGKSETNAQMDVRQAFVYYMLEENLPGGALKIEATLQLGGQGVSYAQWPADGARPEVTHAKPDPFAGWSP